ncbi:MAG: DUF3592 domain-containing protein [Pseudomonadota bacterium]
MIYTPSDPPPGILRLFLHMGGGVVLILGAVLILLTSAALTALDGAQRFESEGVNTRGEASDKYSEESRNSDGQLRTVFYLVVRFETQSGQLVEVERRISAAAYRETQLGQEIELWYLPDDPERVVWRHGAKRDDARVIQALIWAFGLLWLGSIWYIGRMAVGGLRARWYGRQSTAEVVEVQKHARFKRPPLYHLVWRDAEGRLGSSVDRGGAELQVFHPGQEIDVYRGVKRTWWAGDVGYRDSDNRRAQD